MDEQNKLKERTQRYRECFLSNSLGKWVLADIVDVICGLSFPANMNEIAIRQVVAKEILCACDIWFGEGQQTAESFINRLSKE